MEKDKSSNLFVNDGSFMEKFKQLQQDNRGKVSSEEPKSNITPTTSSSNVAVKPVSLFHKKPLDAKPNGAKVSVAPSSGGKLAFSLKQKPKSVIPTIKLGADEDEEEGSTDKEAVGGPSSKRQRLGKTKTSESSHSQAIAACLLSVYDIRGKVLIQRIGKLASLLQNDPAVKSVADKLASFVAKNGRQLENITRQKNPGDTPFRFLFDPSCSDYKYYEHRILEEEKLLSQAKELQASRGGGANASASSSRISSASHQGNSPMQQSLYQTPASALYDSSERVGKSSSTSLESASGEGYSPAAPDPVAMMEFYMKKAAREERNRQPRQSKDEMPPPASLQGPSSKKGHHMGDYIPPEELQKFLANCNDASAQKVASDFAERSKIQADNVGHRLLSKMGWKEGEGLGSSRSGRSDPVMSGEVKQNNLGVGANNPGEVTPEDDIYEQYKKRMMLGYRYRPNPLNNPRKQYY